MYDIIYFIMQQIDSWLFRAKKLSRIIYAIEECCEFMQEYVSELLMRMLKERAETEFQNKSAFCLDGVIFTWAKIWNKIQFLFLKV